MNVVEVQTSQLLDQRLRGGFLEAQVGTLGDRCRSEAQSERVSASDPVDAATDRGVHAVLSQDLERRRVVERPHRDGAEQPAPLRRCEPCGGGRITSGENDTGVLLKRRHEHCAEPGIQQPEHFVVVQGNQHSVADTAEPAGYLVNRGGRDADRGAHLAQEPSFGRLDGPAVEADDDRSPSSLVGEEGVENGGLPDTGGPVQMGEKSLVFSIRHSTQHREFAAAAG